MKGPNRFKSASEIILINILEMLLVLLQNLIPFIHRLLLFLLLRHRLLDNLSRFRTESGLKFPFLINLLFWLLYILLRRLFKFCYFRLIITKLLDLLLLSVLLFVLFEYWLFSFFLLAIKGFVYNFGGDYCLL